MNKQEILECIKHTLREEVSQRKEVEESLIWREGLTIKEKIFPKDIMEEAKKYIKTYNLVLWRNNIYYYDNMKEFTLLNESSMENIRTKIAEIITHTHKTPLEQADEILLLFSASGRTEQY